MNTILSKMGKSVAAFRMLAIDAYCQVSFTEILGITVTSVPTILIYSPLKSRYASFRGAFNEQKVQEFLDGVLHGRISTGPLSQRPEFSEICQGTGPSEVVSEEDSDNSDLLEEIKREETARKLRMKQELEEEKKRLGMHADSLTYSLTHRLTHSLTHLLTHLLAEEKKRAEEEKNSQKKKKKKKSKKKKANNEL